MRGGYSGGRVFAGEQIIGNLREQEAGAKTAGVCCKWGVSNGTFYVWKAMFGGLDVSESHRLRQLEDENALLKKLLPKAMLDDAVTTRRCQLGCAHWRVSADRSAIADLACF